MLRRIFNISLLLLSAWLLAGPLALLQLGAWAWMLTSYSQEGSFEQAITETFGDERPCDICIVVDLLEKNESNKGETQRAENPDIKLMLGLGRAIEMVVPSRAYEPKVTAVCKPENAHLSVPTPPPKVA
jgi:hypothetical protein